MCQSAVYSTVSFCRGYLRWGRGGGEGSNSVFMGNCIRSNTSQNAVFPFPFWHILQLLLHMCSLFSRSLMILFWRRRVGLRPWCTGRVTGRHTWRWWLQGERQCDSLQGFRIGFYLTPPQCSEHFGGNEWECGHKGTDSKDPTVVEWSHLDVSEEKQLVSQ